MRLLICLSILLLLVVPVSLAQELEAPCEGVLLLDAYARPTVTQTGAAYGIVVNLTASDLTLMGGTTPIADVIEIHEMTMSADGVMSMNPLADGLVIPQGSAAVLEPGGYHVMFIGVTAEVALESEVEVELVIEGLEEPIKVALPVMEPPAMEMATEEAMHDHDEMAMHGLSVGFGGCAELDLEALSYSLHEHDGMYMLDLKYEDTVLSIPTASLVHGGEDSHGH